MENLLSTKKVLVSGKGNEYFSGFYVGDKIKQRT